MAYQPLIRIDTPSKALSPLSCMDLPTPLYEQDATHSQFFMWSLTSWYGNQSWRMKTLNSVFILQDWLPYQG